MIISKHPHAVEVKDVDVYFDHFQALNDITISVKNGESYGLVGESGSGKSTLLRAIAGLVDIEHGEIKIDGEVVPTPRNMDFYRQVQMVFQDPYGSLHPRQTIDRLLLEPLAIHGVGDTENKIVRALEEVGLGAGFRFRYPHQLSGGQRQRVAIARALIVEPRILLLDEPTSALDASVQAEVLNLLEQIRRDYNLTFIMVSHDLAVVNHMCDRLAVMRNGQIVEELNSKDLETGNVIQEYTKNLMIASEGFKR